MMPSSPPPTLRLERSRLAAWLDRTHPPEEAVLIGAALVVGLLSAGGAILFRRLVDLYYGLFFTDLQGVLSPFLGRLAVVLLPGVGGLLVAVLISGFLVDERGMGPGVASIMEAVALRDGRLDVRRALVRVLGATITLGSGGSAGPEEPSVQIGAHVASRLGQMLRMSGERTKTLVACGAAAGIAASFNAPLAGAFFALEIILGRFSAAAFGTVVLSAVAASVATQAVVGSQVAFVIPEYQLAGGGDLLLYVLLGVMAASAAGLYIQTLYRLGDRLRGWGMPLPIKTAAGGLMVGLIAAAVALAFNLRPEDSGILGIGYPTLERVLRGVTLAPGLLFVLILVKPLATALTLGSGGQGGVIAPALILGAATGALFSQMVGLFFPGTTVSPAAFALVGMSAVLAAAVRAPIMAILLLLEMTRDYRLALPLLLAVVISTLITERWREPSVYTFTLLRRGIRLAQGRDVDVLAGLPVSEAMVQEPYIVRDDLDLAALERAFADTRQQSFPVLDRSDKLVGVVSLEDLARAKRHRDWSNLKVATICTREVLLAYPDESVGATLRRVEARDIGVLPVVSRREPGRLLGTIGRNEMLQAYRRGLLRRQDMQQRADHVRLSQLAGADFLEFPVEAGSPADGVAVRDLELPEDVLLTAIRRGGITKFPHAADTLHAGDSVLALARSDEAAWALAACFKREFARPRLPPGPREAGKRNELPLAPSLDGLDGNVSGTDQPVSPASSPGGKEGQGKEDS